MAFLTAGAESFDAAYVFSVAHIYQKISTPVISKKYKRINIMLSNVNNVIIKADSDTHVTVHHNFLKCIELKLWSICFINCLILLAGLKFPRVESDI